MARLEARNPISVLFLLLTLGWLPARAQQAQVNLQPCKNSVSAAQQVQLGEKATRQVYQQMPVLPDSSEVTRYVDSIGQKLVAQAPGQHWPFKFHVANVADINAFALPGGEVFVNLGTIQAAEDEAQLAAVMAHEISHVVLQHSICNMQKEQKVGLAAGIGQIIAGLALGNGALGSLAQNTIGITAGLSFLKMSRGAEQQADELGAAILYNAGYDPRAMPQFFEIIEGKYGKGGAQFLSDHPNPGNRTENIDNEIRKFPPRTHYVTNTATFKHIHQLVSGMHAYTAKEVASGVWKRKSPNQTVSTGVNQYDASAANSPIDMSAPRGWTRFNGNGFSMEVPSNWRAAGDQDAAMVAPPGGITVSNNQAGNLVYGLLTDLYKPDQATSGGQAFEALLSQITRENPGLEASQPTRINAGGATAYSAESVSHSANNGRGEHDWIVGFPGNNGLRYFVFVSPEPDFRTAQPTFEHILNSIRMQ